MHVERGSNWIKLIDFVSNEGHATTAPAHPTPCDRPARRRQRGLSLSTARRYHRPGAADLDGPRTSRERCPIPRHRRRPVPARTTSGCQLGKAPSCTTPHHPLPTSRADRSTPRRSAVALVLLAVLACLATACGAKSDSATTVALDTPVSSNVPTDTTITVGDPVTQVALETSGLLKKIPFHVKFANLSGGPQTMEAFRGHALDLGSVADIPPIFAHWTGLKTHIVAAKFRQDPLHHPIYELGDRPRRPASRSSPTSRARRSPSAPARPRARSCCACSRSSGSRRTTYSWSRSPAPRTSTTTRSRRTRSTWLRSAGSTSSATSPTTAPRAAPSSRPASATTRRSSTRPTACSQTPTRRPPSRSTSTFWAQAQRWIKDHPQEWLKAYYEDNQGLDAADGTWLIKNAGTPVIPQDLDEGHRRAPADHRPAVGGGGPARHEGAGPVGPALPARRR